MKICFDRFRKQETTPDRQFTMRELSEDELKGVNGGIWHAHEYSHHFFHREFHHHLLRDWHEHRGWPGHR